MYKGVEIDDAYQMDMVVDGCVIVEVKAVSVMKEPEARQLATYLGLSKYKLGYLINFGSRDFTPGVLSGEFPYRHGIYRIVNNF